MHPANAYNMKQLAVRLEVSVDTVARMEKRGVLPAPFRSRRLGEGRGRCTIRWDRAVIERYIAARSGVGSN